MDTRGTYIGGLEVSGEDGKFAYMWKDDVLQVSFINTISTMNTVSLPNEHLIYHRYHLKH